MKRKDIPEYHVWKSVRRRCRDENYSSGKYVRQRITVCARWEDFENFYQDMGPRPSKKHSIDRIKNEEGYSPSNCRWATVSEQNKNRRPFPRRYLNITGQQFGSLRVVGLLYTLKSWNKRDSTQFWECLCDCGKKTKVRKAALLSENTRSCGCLERFSKNRLQISVR